MVCRFCEVGIPPKEPLDHFRLNHTAKKERVIPMEIRYKIAKYMKTLDLCDPKEVILPNKRIPELKIIKNGFVCKFPNCAQCTPLEGSMRTHYYSHKRTIPKGFKDWEETSLQTFFDGRNKK